MAWNPSPAYLAVLREYGLTEAQVAALVAPAPEPSRRAAPPVVAPAVAPRAVAGQAWPVERGVFAKVPRDPLAEFRR